MALIAFDEMVYKFQENQEKFQRNSLSQNLFGR